MEVKSLPISQTRNHAISAGTLETNTGNVLTQEVSLKKSLKEKKGCTGSVSFLEVFHFLLRDGTL